jgi:CRISPR/Cas system endoribonuclease Cas6 (RAMP superfamily)
MTVRCDDEALSAAVDCYLRFAEYSGVGPLTTHGFGTVSVSAARR